MKIAFCKTHILCLGFVLLCTLVSAAGVPSFVKKPAVVGDVAAIQSLVDAAQAAKLSETRTWRKLMHYERNVFGLLRSQVKSPTFFLSAEGDSQLDQELQATLWSFFGPTDVKDEHAICRFPARLAWLQSKLKDHPAWTLLPKPTCYFFDVFIRNLNAESVSFVFSSYYANNPGSAFGHTFFRVNKKIKEGRSKQELLDYGISYAANVTTGNPVLYMINGLMGGFTGTYVSVPYYYKVREYNDYESRDLWSYELDLTEAEVKQLLNHIWEVGPQYFDYYFFTQNCSYHMLTLMEAVSERIELSNKVPLYVIPSDSVKALFTMPGFVRKVEFRPSLRRNFEDKWNKFTESEKHEFMAILTTYSDAKFKTIQFESIQRKALFLDGLIDYIDMKDPNGIAKHEGPWYQMKEKVLMSRADVDVISEPVAIPVPNDERPDISHPSSRVSLGFGERSITGTLKQSLGFLNFRFAFHELLDDSHGLPARSQLEFGNFKFQYFENDLNLESFSFFNIMQLNPLRKLDPKLSWGIDVGVRNMPLCDGERSCLGSGLQVFGGYAVDWGRHMAWVLPFVHYRYGNSYAITRNYAAVGYQAGYLLEISQAYKLMAKYSKEIPDRYATVDSASVTGRFNFKMNQAVEVEWLNPKLNAPVETQNTKLLFHYFF
tara:strand:- start:64972 stop:66948 length:1977 start_codon:yes stop_codon:yes gene_type:complete